MADDLRIGVDLYRPQLAMLNLFEQPLSGGLSSAARAMVKPESLTPDEAKTLSQRWGVEGFAGGILDTVTSWDVLFAAVTSYRFPVPRGMKWLKKGGQWISDNMFDVGRTIAKDQAPAVNPLLWWARSAHANFRGTGVVEVMDRIIHERMAALSDYLPRFGDAIRKFETSGQKFGQKEQILLTAAMERLHKTGPRGFKDIGPIFKKLPTDKPFQTLVQDWRKVYDDMWNSFFDKDEHRKAIAKGLRAMQEVGAPPAAVGVGRVVGKKRIRLPDLESMSKEEQVAALREYFQRVEHYAPHFPTKHMSEYVAQVNKAMHEAINKTGATREQYVGGIAASTLRQISKAARKRKHRMLPAVADLDLVREYVDDKAYAQIKSKVKFSADQLGEKLVATPTEIPMPAVMEYNMRAADVAATYTNSAASMRAWTLSGGGEDLLDKMYELSASGEHLRAKMLRDTYIPALMGKMTYEQAKNQQLINSHVMRMHDWLNSKEAAKIPKAVRTQLQKWMVDERGSPLVGSAYRHAASYMYLSALGGNPASAARNLAQLILTTGPTIGGKYTGKGIQNAMEKSGRYFDLRVRGAQHGEAFAKAFPEYHEAGIPLSPMVDETVGEAVSNAYDAWAPSKLPLKAGERIADRVKRMLMKMFSMSEQTVRVVTFEGAMAKGMDDLTRSASKARKALGTGPTALDIKREALRFARQTVQETQFLSGPVNTPYFLMDKNPVVRQFTQFMSRYFEYMTHTAWRIGAAERTGRKVPGMEWLYGWMENKGINPGTFARAVLWSDIAGRLGYEALGLDLDESLMPGAWAAPRAYGVGAPLPFLPPIATIAGAPLIDLAKGDLSMEMTRRQALPLMVPGGVGAARYVGLIPGGEAAAKAVMKSYADYTKMTPDGRIPVYTDKGNLMGYATLGNLLMKGTGIGEGGQDFPNEQTYYKWLLANRDRLRQYRSGFMDAVMDGDMQTAGKIDAEFQRALPGAGSLEQWIKESHWIERQRKQQITRMEKLLDTLPSGVRERYAMVLQAALLQSTEPQFYGFEEPTAFSAGQTQKARDKVRSPMRDSYSNYTGSPLRSTPGGLPLSQVSYGAYDSGPFNSFAAFQGGAGP